MAFKTLEELTGVVPRRGGNRNLVFSDDQVLFATDKRSKVGEKQSFAMRIEISAKLVRKARFKVKDKIETLFDPDEMCGLLMRVPSGGNQLCKYSSKPRFTVKAAWYPGMPTTAETVGCLAEITDDGIVFMLPDSVSFEKNLRA